MTTLTVSVRSLVAHSLRSGDLIAAWEPAHPLDGSRLHRKLQKSRGENYRSEVPVCHLAQHEGWSLRVQGRIDGVEALPDRVIIEEIKTTSRDLDQIDGWADPLHWGQAKVYAWIYCREEDLDRVEVRITYAHRRSGETREFSRGFAAGELGVFFEWLVNQYIDWRKKLDSHRSVRDAFLQDAAFPFPNYRPGQRRLAVAVYRSLAGGGQLLTQAPTGIGKTMAVVFPALKAISKGFASRLLYVTPRTTGKAIAESTLRHLRGRGLPLKSVTLTARDKICFNPGKACDAAECEFAKGYYDRIAAARENLFALDDFGRSTIEELARQHTVCPFALSLELARWSDVLICDYHYVFSPSALSGALGLEEDTCFLGVDEAHNLVDRAREMHSAQIRLKPLQSIRRAVKEAHPAVWRSLGAVASRLRKIRKACRERGGATHQREAPSELSPALLKFVERTEALLGEGSPEAPLRQPLLDAYFDALRFIRVADEYGPQHATCCQESNGDFSVTLFCLDPAPRLAETFRRFPAAALFSATLTPIESHRRTLGCAADSAGLVLPSPFPRRNLCVTVADRVCTLYRSRRQTSLEVARLLASFVGSKPGNYLLFFPSYQYLTMVAEQFAEIAHAIPAIIQQPGMAEAEREAFLAAFQADADKTLAGFAVLGGVFSEGVDLVGDRLSGAAIVGVGLPGLSPERESVRHYLPGENGDGYDVAYRFPGMQRVLQAAGRVIRSENDRGAVLLIDPRFAHAAYRRLMPPDWAPTRIRDADDLAGVLGRFWNQTARPAKVPPC